MIHSNTLLNPNTKFKYVSVKDSEGKRIRILKPVVNNNIGSKKNIEKCFRNVRPKNYLTTVGNMYLLPYREKRVNTKVIKSKVWNKKVKKYLR